MMVEGREMDKRARNRVVRDLQALWPHINFAERWVWIGRIQPLFDGDFTAAAFAVLEGVAT